MEMGWGLERKLIWGLRALSNVPPPAPPCTKAGQDYEQGADDRGMEAKSATQDLSNLGQVTWPLWASVSSTAEWP